MSQRPHSRRALAAIVALAAALTPSVAAADDALRFSMDWDKLGVVLHEGASSLLPHESWHAEPLDQTQGGSPPPWIGMSPRLALVARDWGVSQVLWGHLAVTDQFRLSRSSRMVVTFTAPKNATTGPNSLVIRSVLSQSDYNDWPVIVWVQ